MSRMIVLRELTKGVAEELMDRPDLLVAFRKNPKANADSLGVEVKAIPRYFTWSHDKGRVAIEPPVFRALVTALEELRPEEGPLLAHFAPDTPSIVLPTKLMRRIAALLRFVEAKEVRPKVEAALPDIDGKLVSQRFTALKKLTAACAFHGEGAFLFEEEELPVVATPKKTKPADRIAALEVEVERLRALCAAHGIDPNPGTTDHEGESGV